MTGNQSIAVDKEPALTAAPADKCGLAFRQLAKGAAVVQTAAVKIGGWLLLAGCTRLSWRRKAAARGTVPVMAPSKAATITGSDLGLLRDLQCVIDLYPKVPHGAFQLGVAK